MAPFAFMCLQTKKSAYAEWIAQAIISHPRVHVEGTFLETQISHLTCMCVREREKRESLSLSFSADRVKATWVALHKWWHNVQDVSTHARGLKVGTRFTNTCMQTITLIKLAESKYLFLPRRSRAFEHNAYKVSPVNQPYACTYVLIQHKGH
jgi:hypothetical protein